MAPIIMPMIVPVPSGHWGIGPTLVYVVGIFCILFWLAWDEDAGERANAREVQRADAERKASEQRKADRFTQLLIEAAQERRATKSAKKGD